MISVVIATYGEDSWRELAWTRAYTSTIGQGADEVIVHHSPDLEIGPVRNLAALRAGGDYLIFLDADDELEPGYIDAMRVALAGNPGNRLFQPSVRYVRKGRSAPPILAPEKDLRVDNFLVIGTMVKTDVFMAVGGFGNYPHGFEDWSCWAKCWKAGATIVPVPDAIYRAYINPRSKHRQMWRDRKTQVATHLRVQAELFPEFQAR